MGGWYLAPSLAVLRDEINRRWPGRDRTSDGTIGDTAHAATKSDHNPNDRGAVNAIDIDRDGVTVSAIIAAAERHPSVHYWIYNRQIADRDNGFRRVRYTGSNPHDKHIHISIRQTQAAEQDRRPWGLLAGEDDEMTDDDRRKLNAIYAFMFLGGPSCGFEVNPGNGRGNANSLVNKADELLKRPAVQPAPVDVAALAELLAPHLEAAAERAVRRVLGAVDGATPGS